MNRNEESSLLPPGAGLRISRGLTTAASGGSMTAKRLLLAVQYLGNGFSIIASVR